MVRDVMAVRFSNASLVVVQFSALNVTDVMLGHTSKAYLGIVVTASPMVRDASAVHPPKIGDVEDPILVQFSALKATEVMPLQSLKAESPIVFTELGMVIDVRPLQPSKAPLPISVTELPMVSSPVRPVQP